ncbi:MAG TPA: DUF4375 domain-containing protein [Acidimicrobiales bacterium]
MDDIFAALERMQTTPLTRQLIAELPDGQLDDWVWARSISYAFPADHVALVTLPEGVRAYIATRLFEWEVGNGGLHQYFFNHPSSDLLSLVIDGYAFLGLEAARRIVAEDVAPIAEREKEWRESLRDGSDDTFANAYADTELTALDERIEFHDAERLRYVRGHPDLFAR